MSGHNSNERKEATPGVKSDSGSKPNPFASPQLLPTPETGDALVENSGFVARAIFGLWAGVLFGGTFGAGGSFVLGITNSAVLGVSNIKIDMEPLNLFMQIGIITAIAGAISGLFVGSIIGPIISIMSYVGQQNRRSVMYCSIAFSAVAGSAVGFIGSRIMSEVLIQSIGWEAGFIGIFVGSISGIIGGFQLARSIVSFASGEIS